MLGGRQIPYTRGKGLGGSSILNFGVYLWGSKRDYERWDELVGEDEDGEGTFKWENVKRSFQKIENYNFSASETYRHLADPSKGEHGTNGKLHVWLPPVLETAVQPQMEALAKAGEKLNLDPNSGDPTGISIFPANYSKNGRCTSAMAHLANPPKNLEVWTDAKVTKLVWEGKKVVGIVTENGKEGTFWLLFRLDWGWNWTCVIERETDIQQQLPKMKLLFVRAHSTHQNFCC